MAEWTLEIDDAIFIRFKDLCKLQGIEPEMSIQAHIMTEIISKDKNAKAFLEQLIIEKFGKLPKMPKI